MNGVCYEVVAMTFPWTQETCKPIGYYNTQKLASEVAAIIKAFNSGPQSCEIKVKIEECKNMEGIVGKVRSSLDFDELAYLAALRFTEGEDVFLTIGAV